MMNTKKLFLFIIIFSLLFSQGKALNSAKVYIKDKNWKQAEFFLLQAIEHPKDKWEAAFHLGDKVYVRSQDWAKVKQYMDLADGAPENIKIRPTRNDNKIPIATAILASKTRSYQSLLYKADGYNNLLNTTADPTQRESFLEQAIVTSMLAKDLAPNEPGAYYLLSVFYSLKNDRENTLKYIKEGLAIEDLEEDRKLSLFVGAGAALVRLGDYDMAMGYFKQATDLDDTNPALLKSLGALYLEQGEYDNALNMFNKAIDLAEEDEAKVDLLFDRGLTHLRLGNFEKAEDDFDDAYDRAPEDIGVLFGFATALEKVGRWRKARSFYMELIDVDPNNASYYYGVYSTYFNEGRLEDAAEYLNKANALKNQN